MKKYSHDNWNQVLALPDGPEKEEQLQLIGSMAVGNLMWFVRRVIAREEDLKLSKMYSAMGMSGWEMIEPSPFTVKRRALEREAADSKDK